MQKKDKKDYENLGKMLVNIYETGYLNKNESYKNAFFKGAVSGVGGVIGATIVVALLVWLLTLFKHVPLVGPITNNVKDTIQKSKDSNNKAN